MSSIPDDPDTTPALAPPDGVVPNFKEPVSNAYLSRYTIYVFLPLMSFFLASRVYSRTRITHSFGVDDGTKSTCLRHLPE
ncbi:hypothetical protein F4780DRAFT_723461 [Xylariomycetidae sp. FL0641]|nr:hypothetical protein F4780DRAFT_723461 [Xylariomycetidae sp. FL0641]